ncbi:MAG: ABC transporter ATP-binding protein [Anaerorhabdus sp.]
MTILKVDGLKKTFKLSKKQMKVSKSKLNKIVAVNDLSFEIFEGEIYGLLGPNGAGKTTTLRMLATLIKPDAGNVEILGESIAESPEKIRKNIAFLTNELKLEGYFTPNYLYKFFSDLHGIPTEIQSARKEKLFKQFGIDKFEEVKYEDLSTGMKQKVSIVISLVHDPKLIIFDEPTNGLDIMTAKVVTDFLISLKNEGKTIILSTHIFSLVEKVCDRVGIIMDGKMICSNTVENIKNGESMEDAFFKLYENYSGGENNE